MHARARLLLYSLLFIEFPRINMSSRGLIRVPADNTRFIFLQLTNQILELH